MQQLMTLIRIIRPANVVTAIADILAGIAASGALLLVWESSRFDTLLVSSFVYLMIASACLYAGGIVFNDFFDADVDALERPERAIPSGDISPGAAATYGMLLFMAGIGAAAMVHFLSAAIALGIVLLCLSYNAFTKHIAWAGPLNMGACRGANLLLGISVIPSMVANYWYLSLIPIIFIAAVTMVSRGEVAGGNPSALRFAAALYLLVTVAIGSLGLAGSFSSLDASGFLLYFAYRVFPPLMRAIELPDPSRIRIAVKAGVLSLIVMDAAIGAGFGGVPAGLIILALLPGSLLLAKQFAVT